MVIHFQTPALAYPVEPCQKTPANPTKSYAQSTMSDTEIKVVLGVFAELLLLPLLPHQSVCPLVCYFSVDSS